MKLQIEVTLRNENGDEVVHHLPAKHEVCRRCEGHGTHLTPSIGEHCYTQEEFEREFCDEEAREAYLTRGGMLDVTCLDCNGKNVVPVVDRSACTTEELKAVLNEYDRQAREERDYQRLVASELRFGC